MSPVAPEASILLAGDAAWMLIAAGLVTLMTPGLALFYGGMAGRRAVLNLMMMSFGAAGVVTVVYILWGWSMSYGSQSLAGLFANPFELFGLRGAIHAPQPGPAGRDAAFLAGDSGYAAVLDIAFQLTFAVISTALISGALAGRVRFATWLVFSGAWATLVYFPLAHMVWGGGLLSHGPDGVSAAMFGTVREHGEEVAAVAPIDFAGGTVVHISAGVAALVLALVVGPRSGFPRRLERPHNLPLVMLGAALLWFGWFGFNGGSALSASGLTALANLNTTAAAAAGMLGWLLVERLRDGRPTSLGAASGVVAGLVAITPAAGDLIPLTALPLGAVGGVLAALAIPLKYRLGYDDSLDVVGVHLVAGLWGTVGVGLLAEDRGLFVGGGAEGWRLLVVQIVIALLAVLISGAVTILLALALRILMGWRVDAEAEYHGVDVAEHRETAYEMGGDARRGGLGGIVAAAAAPERAPRPRSQAPAAGDATNDTEQ